MSSAAGKALKLRRDTPEADSIALSAVRGLHRASPRFFWVDLLGSCFVGWTAVGFASTRTLLSIDFVACVLVAALALYRALCFIHELTHVRPGALPGFETGWNLLVGVPILMPSFIYTMGVHLSHHR